MTEKVNKLRIESWDARHSKRLNSVELREAFKAREAAEKANKENPTPENAAKLAKAKARYDKAAAEHDDMPHEFDAERVGAKVEDQYEKQK